MSAVEAFVRMPIPYHAYFEWVRTGDSESAAQLDAYEHAKGAALRELDGEDSCFVYNVAWDTAHASGPNRRPRAHTFIRISGPGVEGSDSEKKK